MRVLSHYIFTSSPSALPIKKPPQSLPVKNVSRCSTVKLEVQLPLNHLAVSSAAVSLSSLITVPIKPQSAVSLISSSSTISLSAPIRSFNMRFSALQLFCLPVYPPPPQLAKMNYLSFSYPELYCSIFLPLNLDLKKNIHF